MVFNDERVTKHFNLTIWVCVSDDFDEKKLLKIIVGQIEKKSTDVDDLASLQRKLQGLLNGKRYLLVLDDVWNEDQDLWDKLKADLNVGAKGACVLVTTRLEKVGSIMATLRPYQLSNLSQQDCWSLFKHSAFRNQGEANPNLVAIGEEIVKKCGGVPLAAKTLGSLLLFKNEESEWKHVRDSDIWNLRQDENSIFPALRLSYHHLPLELRQCFAYCAVFPKDTKMLKKELITLWMAHGFFLPKGNMEPEDVGNEVWTELHQRSLFQEVEEGEDGKTRFKMHDLTHDLATSVFKTNTWSCKVRQVNVGGESTTLPIGFCRVVPCYSPMLLKEFLLLRVLDLSLMQGSSSRDSGLKQLSSSIGDLIHLRFLNLSGNGGICSLPKRLCKLQNLQTLDLTGCSSLVCLPKETSKLTNLRNLLLMDCYSLSCTPPRIGSLTCLRTLGCFIVGDKKGYEVGELGNLNLQGSLEIRHLERVKKCREAILSTKANLNDLIMCWDRPFGYKESEKDMDDTVVLEALKPHPNLKTLEISRFRGSRFPEWMVSDLKNIVSIKIDGCEKWSCLPSFGKLPFLENLDVSHGPDQVEYFQEEAAGFPSLRSLEIRVFHRMKGLVKKEGVVDQEKFPKLEKMKIGFCPNVVFPALSSVKELEFWGDADSITWSSISKLTTLTSLTIAGCEVSSFPEDMFKGLANLEVLHITVCFKLEELPTSMEDLASLTKLTVDYSEMLKSLPEGLQHLTALKRLTIKGSPEVAKRCEREIGEDWYKIAHIPDVRIN